MIPSSKLQKTRDNSKKMLVSSPYIFNAVNYSRKRHYHLTKKFCINELQFRL
jgi:hypothetical protein